MTALLYISYSSGLSEDDKLIIDRQVSRNRETVCIVVKTLASNAKDKTKRVIVVITLVSVFWFSNLESAEAIGLSMPPTPVVKVQPNYKDTYETKVAPTASPKLDKITFIKYRELPVCIYMMDERFLKTSETSKLINKIRGGGLIEAATALVVIVAMWQILGVGIEGFVLNNPNPGWGVDRPNPFQPPGGHLRYPPVYELFFPRRTPGCTRPGSTLQINRPTAMPYEEFVGLTKEERRALPHSNDMTIIHEGRSELEVGFWQSKFKVGDHGTIHDLPYTVKANGGTKTEKSDDNALKMMRSIVDMPNRDNVQWFEDGTYQGGTDREFKAIHIYDLDKKVIAVFQKSTGKFVTTCQLDRDEHNELLKSTHNFGGGKGWYSRQVKNLPPQQTAVNTFESDVTGMTPLSPMNENSSPGFTPTSSFESDVMGITPIDKSQFDNP
jgi:hypothetical protein